MTDAPDAFFPFNPRVARAGFLLGALGCAALTAWAAWGALHHTERMGEARAGISAGLMLAFFYAVLRLRPRLGWGVTLGTRELTVARPLSSEPIHLPWSRVERVLRVGKSQDTLVVLLEDQGRVLIARHLFARRSTFEALCAALRERVPEPRLDA